MSTFPHDSLCILASPQAAHRIVNPPNWHIQFEEGQMCFKQGSTNLVLVRVLVIGILAALTSGVAAGGGTLLTWKFQLTYREKRCKEKNAEMEKKKRKIEIGKVEN